MKFNKTFRSRKFRKLFMICVCLVLAVGQMIPMTVHADAPVTGTFATKAPPVVNSVTVETLDSYAEVLTGKAEMTLLLPMAVDYSGGNAKTFTINGVTVTLNAAVTANDAGETVITNAINAAFEPDIAVNGVATADIVLTTYATDIVLAPGTATDLSTVFTAEAALGRTVARAGMPTVSFSGTNMIFTLNGTNITLNTDYTAGGKTWADIASDIQAKLTLDSNTTVTVSGTSNASGKLTFLSAAGQSITFASTGTTTGDLKRLGLPASGKVYSAVNTSSSFTPGMTYDIKVDVNEPDGIGSSGGGLDNVDLKLWYDAGGVSNTVSTFNARTTPATKTYARILWSVGTNEATLEAGTGTSWQLVSVTKPTAGELANSADINHQFVFRVKIGSIATETDGTSEWQVAAKATDKDSETSFKALTNGLPMNWYGSIAVPTGTKADWGRVQAGLTENDAASKVTINGIDMLANGTYDYGIKADTTWTGANGNTVTRALQAGVNAGTKFAILATKDSAAGAGADIDATALAIKTLETAQTASATYTPTTKSSYLYLELPSNFSYNGELFTGTLTYVIRNG